MIFKIPVSGLSPKKAKNTLSQLMNSYRNNNRKIQVLLEDSLYKDNLEEFKFILDKNLIEYKTYKYIPFRDKKDILSELYELFPEYSEVFFYGSHNLAEIIVKSNWNIGVLGKSFNNYICSNFYKIYENNILNIDYKLITINDLTIEYLNENFKDVEDFFIKPNNSIKVFTGFTFYKDLVKDVKEFIQNKLENAKSLNEGLIICKKQMISSEIRVVIIDNKPITASYYRKNNIHYEEEINIYENKELYNFIINNINLYSPDNGWTMDIVITDGKYKLLEIGGLSYAGFYKCNLQKIIDAIHHYKNNHYYWL